VTWRYSLAGVQAASLSLHNFKAGPNNLLSFQAELLSMTTANGIINLLPKGAEASIVYLSFSVIVVTQNSASAELLTFSNLNLSAGSDPVLYANSSKFDFNSNISSPYLTYGYQWVTGLSNYLPNITYFNYWTYAYISTYPLAQGYEIKLFF
jgi:hypothetical protein